jgi:hypothetical protein
MAVSGQHHAPAALYPRGKGPRYPLYMRLGGFVFQIIDKTIRNSKFRCLSEATPYYHNVFTFTSFLPEGRTGVAWEPSNKMMLFLLPRKIKCLSLQPLISYLNLLFIYPSHLCLSLSSTLNH